MLAAQDPESGVVHQLLQRLSTSTFGGAGVLSFTDLVKLLAKTLQLLTWELGKISESARGKCDVFIS